jgi:trans-aconitate 2-methyltransferase
VSSSPPSENQNFLWNPSDYAANSTSQLVWAREPIARLALRSDEHILDVGCGNGKVTAELSRALPQGSVVGIDSSAEMGQFAAGKFSDREFANLQFKVMDARQIHFRQLFDLVVSNAALHWVDDHPSFLRGAAACLYDGGRLVVSCGGRGQRPGGIRGLTRRNPGCAMARMFPKARSALLFYMPVDYERWLPSYGLSTASINLRPPERHPRKPGRLRRMVTHHLDAAHPPRTGKLLQEFIATVVLRYLVKQPTDVNGHVQVRMVRLEIDAVKPMRPICDRRESEVCIRAETQFGAPIK